MQLIFQVSQLHILRLAKRSSDFAKQNQEMIGVLESQRTSALVSRVPLAASRSRILQLLNGLGDSCCAIDCRLRPSRSYCCTPPKNGHSTVKPRDRETALVWRVIRSSEVIYRAFSPLESWPTVPGASPQAGICRAFGPWQFGQLYAQGSRGGGLVVCLAGRPGSARRRACRRRGCSVPGASPQGWYMSSLRPLAIRRN